MLEKLPHEINDLSEVKSFCDEQHPESRWLDYKQDYEPTGNDKIAKLIAAMANAHGGWILFGVEEKKDTQNRGIPGDIKGVQKTLSLGARIKQIALDRINPPIVPEIGQCDVDTDREVVLVKIHESDSTPHELHNGRVYVRTNDISHLADDGRAANVREIELLLNRRAKAKELRARLVARSIERCQNNSRWVPQLSYSCFPLFPDEPLCDYAELYEAAKALQKYRCLKDSERLLSAHEAILGKFERRSSNNRQNNRTTFELGLYGSFFYRTEHFSSMEENGRYLISSRDSLELIYTLIQATEKFHTIVGFSGLVEMTLGLHCEDNVIAAMTAPTDSGKINAWIDLEPVPDQNIVIRRQLLSHQIYDPTVIENLYREFLWSAGLGPVVWDWEKPGKLVAQIHSQLG